jgi:hypothetical protein
MMAVSVTTGQAFTASTARTLFEGRFAINGVVRGGYDVSPDGQRFLMVQEKERLHAKVTQMILVQNWFEELKRRVPAKPK